MDNPVRHPDRPKTKDARHSSTGECSDEKGFVPAPYLPVSVNNDMISSYTTPPKQYFLAESVRHHFGDYLEKKNARNLIIFWRAHENSWLLKAFVPRDPTCIGVCRGWWFSGVILQRKSATILCCCRSLSIS